MKHFTLFLRKGFTSALTLAFAMIVLGGGSALADTVIFDSSTGNDIAGWTKSSINLYYSTPKVLYTNQSGTLTSNDKITFLSGDRFIIEAKGRYSGNAGITVKYSTDGSDWTTAKEFSTTTSTFPTSSQDYAELVVDNIVGTYYIQLDCANMSISLIKIANAPSTPHLSVSPSSVAFGAITGNNSQTITVSNTGAGTMDVTIANDNTTDFTVSATSLTGIGAGESQTFNVTFNFDDENLGDKSANITVTPSYAAEAAVVIPVTATSVELIPDYTFDENVSSSWSSSWSGTKAVLFKYTPSNGWNTFCVPFEPAALMDDIFGAGWKAYTFSSYSEGTISFSKATNVAARVPYVVYVETAASHPSGILFETSSNIYGSPTDQTNGKVTFKGTYAPKAAGTLTGNYGVTSDGRIVKAGSGASIKGYRAYFTGVPAGSGIKGFVIDGEDATDIGLVQMVEGSDKPVYNMSGQKVQKAQRGIYIINGKKVVIK